MKKNRPIKAEGLSNAQKDHFTSQIKAISQFLEGEGFTIRREELKRGLGWKATSGVCRKDGTRMIFVDRRTSPGEQCTFLMEAAKGVISEDRSIANRLPDEIKHLFHEL